MRGLLLLLLLFPLVGQEPLPRGQVIPKVACSGDPRFSYAIYIPSGFRENQRTPVLFGFSPSAAGEEPVRVFQQAAERFGWIVVGSNDSRNGPIRPALEASAAMWKDVQARFPVDQKRCYAAGFSGGARMALRLAMKHPRQFAGIVSIGAFGIEDGLLTGLGHVRFHLSCGLEDFNHWELLEGRQELRSRGWKAVDDRFPGGHRWATEEMALTALSCLQLGAMEDGLLPMDETLRDEVSRRLVAQAEQAGASLLGMRRWVEVAGLFPRWPEGRRAVQEAERLGQVASVKREVELEAYYLECSKSLAMASRSSRYRDEMLRHLDRLPVADPIEQVMIRRVLGVPMLTHQVALGDALEKQDWKRVHALSTSLAALDEREGWPCIYVAAALVQMGRSGEALSHLRAALDRGYRKPERIRDLEWLKPLRGQPEFEGILQAMKGVTEPSATKSL